MPTIQERSSRQEKHWNRAVGILRSAMPEWSALANDAGASEARKAMIDIKIGAVNTAIFDLCGELQACAGDTGVTVNSTPPDKD